MTNILLQRLIRVGNLRHITACPIDCLKTPFIIAERKHLQLIAHLITLKQSAQSTFVTRPPKQLRHIGVLHLLYILQVLTQHIGQRNPGFQYGVQPFGESPTGLLVHVCDNTVLIICHNVHQRVVENGLIAQHGILGLLLAQFLFCHIAGGSYNFNGLSVLAATEHRESNGQIAQLSLCTVFCLNIKSHFLDFPKRDV